MSLRGPRFLDKEDGPPQPETTSATHSASIPAEEPASPRGPMLLAPERDAPDRLELAWKPDLVAVPRPRIGTATWIAAGFGTIVLTWVVLSIASFFLALLAQSIAAAALGLLLMTAGLAMIACAAGHELRAYRSLGAVEQLKADLSSAETTTVTARRHGRAWLRQVQANIPDPASVGRMLDRAETVAEIRSILRSQVADRLREAARALGTHAAVEGATLVAICPHPAWDGVIAGGRGLLVIRQVAALYGLRPGIAVTLGLTRRVVWMAAGTTGVALVAQGLADHALTAVPVVKHLASVLPGSGAVSLRLYRLAGVTAEACSPVPD